MRRAQIARLEGSPPLARGKESKERSVCFVRRITPACAGKSQVPHSLLLFLQDHPRLRGEKYRNFTVLRPDPGSPPLARGIGQTKVLIATTVRITPACAGKSTVLPLYLTRSWGSPPLARGKAAPAPGHRTGPRITPACAGKRPLRRRCPRREWDHPRLRGEKNVWQRLTVPSLGSPPLARGKAWCGCRDDEYERITPACAGKSGISLHSS